MNGMEEELGYDFSNKSLLEEALMHPSISRQDVSGGKLFNYERLEFLGDSVLGLVIAEILMAKYPHEKEGHLAKRQAGLVRGEAVTKVGRKINIGRYIRMTQGEESMGGRDNPSNIENAMEAVIGAVYLDGGLNAAKDFINRHWVDLIDDMKEPPRDDKTALQEWAQGRGLPIPQYTITNTKGPSHDPIFEVEVSVKGLDSVKAVGSSKKKAEKDAAKALLALIKEQNVS